MAFVATVAFIIGFVLLVLWAGDRQLCLNGLRRDLSAYLDQAEEVVRVADDIHYKAVVYSLTKIYNDYFPARN